ncbi:uncharacterized protein LOC111861744 [Cryptotermes secundus]|nr:uncharacterized protein LOC111861744 [Cryptotermes secundus]
MGDERSHRNKRDYSVFEHVDDISTTAWTPSRRYGPRDVRRAEPGKRLAPHRPTLRSTRTDTDRRARERLRQRYLALDVQTPKSRLLLLNIPTQPEILVKRFDLKTLTKYVDYFIVPSHNLTDSSEEGFTYHPSRLMGLNDILNTDSLLDLLMGLGAHHDKLIITIPATALRFTLKNVEENTPRSPVTDGKETLTQTELCTLLADGGWTIERDDDLTAPYAFKNDSWIAFDDKISVGIKSKYVLLRDLGGAALYAVDSADWSGSCLEENSTRSRAPLLLHTLYHAFTSLARKSRGVLLETLQQDIRTSSLRTVSGDVRLSPYRVVRVVDPTGHLHVVRRDSNVELTCTRPGFFRHPRTCKRFYRCVKFDQDSDEFTVFVYDCPPGLIFEQRWEICIWPGTTLEDPCYGSTEIAPVPKARYICPTVEGYYADPENCRWFFACLDHARDGISPLTAYEFRCPFGLVFDEKNLLCQWPWLVDGCGKGGAATGAYFGSVTFGGARRGYIATAGNGYTIGGGGAGTVLSQASGSAFVTAGDLNVRSGIGVTSGADRTVVQRGAGLVTGYEAGYGAGGVLLTEDNTGSNERASLTHAAGANRGNVKYSGSSALGGELGGQIANAYITGGRSSESFGNAGSYNEGRYISSYASLPDSYVSGGRIENSGGFVSGEYVGVHGIGAASAYISGGQAAGISTDSKNAFIGSSGSARALYSSNVAHGNEGLYFSGGDLSSVSDQTVVKTPNVPGLLATTFKKPAVAQLPIVHPTAVPPTAHQQRLVGISQVQTLIPSVEKVPVVQPAAIPVAQAVPVTAYQQTVVETPQAPAVPVTTFREAAVSKIPAVQPAVVPLPQRVPVTAFQQTVVETPQAPILPVTTFRKPAIAKIPVVQPAVVPVAQTVPATVYQQTVTETPSPVVRVTPAVAKVPVTQSAAVSVAEAAPVTLYQEIVGESPAVATIPVAPAVSLVQKTVPVTTHVRRPTVSHAPIVGAAPLATYFQETPVVSDLSTRTKLRPVAHQAPIIPVARPVVPIVNTYLSTPAPTVLPIQTEFSEIGVSGFAIGRGAGEGRHFQGRPAISVATNGAAGISVPNVSSDIETFGAVVTENAVPVTPAPVIRAGVSSGGHSFSTTATTVITSGSVPVSSVQSKASSGNVQSPPNSAILSSNYLPVTPVVTSGISNGAYSYSTPASAILTGDAVSIKQVPVLKSHVPSESYSLSTHLPTEKSNAPSSEYSYSSPAPNILSSGTVSVKPNVGVYSVPSIDIVPGDTVSIINTRITPAVGYSYPKPSSTFATGKAATFRGVSLASGLEPAVFESSPGLASGLEIPSSTAGPTFVGSDVTGERYSTKVGATRLTAPPASNIEISNIHKNGYASSSVTDVPRISISRGYTLSQKALLSSNVEPIHSVSIADGEFGARKSDLGRESVAPYPAEARERFSPQINATYGAPPVTVYTTDSNFISVTGHAQGRGRPYLGPGYVSSAPIPTTPTPGPRIFYSDTPRPNFVSSTSSPAAYMAEIIPKSDGVVSTPVPAVTSTLIGETSAPVSQSTSSDHQNLEVFGSRLGQSASRRKPAPIMRINYDNENTEALLDKYSGKFGGLLDNNKEGFISGIINDDLVDRDRGRVIQNSRVKASQRGRVDTVSLSGLNTVYSATGYSDRSSSIVSGTTAGFSTTPATDIGSSTLGNTAYISTTSSPNSGGFRGKFRYGSKVNTEADGGNGYDAITVGLEDSKLRSKQEPVVFITRLSDVNPLLIAKLGAQCTCKSNTVTLKKPDDFSNVGISGSKLAPISSATFDDDVTSRSGTYNIPEHIPLAPLPGSNLVTGSSPDMILGLNDEISSTSQSLTPVPLSTPKTNEFLEAIGLDEIRVTPAPTVLITTSRPRTKLTGDAYKRAKPVDIRYLVPSNTDVRLRTGPQRLSTTPEPLDKVSSTISSATGIRYRTRPEARNVVSTTAVPVAVVSGGYHEAGSLGPGADAVASTRGSGVRTDGSLTKAGSGATGAGRSFDRYGPGGWRGLDETLQGSVDCQRAGLFRHPKYCNKFYACYWDEWKGRYTLHVFNCPVHLAYDSNLGACNWPSKGPACSDDNLLV